MTGSDETVGATVHEFATRFGEQSFEEAVELLTEAGREQVVAAFPDEFQQGPLDPTEALSEYWWGLYGQHGEFEGIGAVTVGDGVAEVELCFANGSETATVEFEGDEVTAFSFSPAYEVPEYVDREAFAEHDVIIDAGDIDLGGILAVPEGDRSFPGVLLVHGHGLHDPDGTVGASKILKDVAWGLASEGIATLRYEKRLFDHEVADENYTLDTVVTDDAVAALSRLAEAEEIDAGRVFIAGHSQGGMVAPRIADRFEDCAGVISLDGTPDSMVDPDGLAWLRYSMEMDGELDEEQEAEFEEMRETFRRLEADEYDDDETILGKPGVWHRSHRDCDPLVTSSGLDSPVFVLTTSRADEKLQPELAAFRRQKFEVWQDTDLPPGSRVEFYEHVGHYFQHGPTPVAPSTLYFGGNVAGYVVADLVEWIHGVCDD
ncbi:alpha/beta fold hydrolase [Haladaptatus sp. DYSN1]|uniref:alpha/beta fold hydrolase n=1 Tax=unclassified Haladaptatus TaxID=2622732 RepID=UPI0024062A48|nr:alpha/beta fold hydrolase [Haladaptatus sp. DYSN1]